jgi:translation initiation factor 2D
VAGGRDAPEALQGWGDELADDKLADIADLEIEDQEEAEEDGGVSLEHAADRNAHATGADNSIDDASHEPTTKEIDEAFQEAFIYALFDAKKTGSPPNYSLDLPIQPSFLIANMIQPHLRSQNQHYTIKKTSWKNVKKFIKHLDKQQLVKSKDRNGGETVILDVDFEDRQITQFTPYALPKTRGDESGDGPAANGNADSSLSQDFTLQYLYRASSKLVPDLIPSKTDYYTRAQISDYIRTYVENNPDLNDGVSSKRFIKLNPFIANNILSRTKSDNQILVNGEIARDALQKQILDDTHLCMPFWVLLKADQKWDPESPDRTIPKPKAGSPPKVTITIEKRTGTKTVTRVTGLETFNVSPQTMAPELQKRCASSASVEQAVGGKPGMMEVSTRFLQCA